MFWLSLHHNLILFFLESCISHLTEIQKLTIPLIYWPPNSLTIWCLICCGYTVGWRTSNLVRATRLWNNLCRLRLPKASEMMIYWHDLSFFINVDTFIYANYYRNINTCCPFIKCITWIPRILGTTNNFWRYVVKSEEQVKYYVITTIVITFYYNVYKKYFNSNLQYT